MPFYWLPPVSLRSYRILPRSAVLVLTTPCRCYAICAAAFIDVRAGYVVLRATSAGALVRNSV